VGYSRALRKGDRLAAAAWVTMLGRTLLDCGQVASARRVLSEALAACRQPVAACFLPVCLAAIAESAALSGDVVRAQEAVAEETGHVPMACFRTDLDLARSWLAAASGDLCAGRAIALAAAAAAEAEGRLAGAVTALHTAARLGDAAPVRRRLERLTSVVDGPFAAACAAHAGALADRDGSMLDRAAAEFEGMGAYLMAAEAAAAARAVHQAEGRRGSALASSDRLRSLLERCEGAHSPGLAGLKMAELTVREQEVAHLAASGLSSREIAQRLTLSVRTVDNHLRVTYDKLGVDGRRSLPRALRSHAGTERSGSTRRYPLEARPNDVPRRGSR
jgi:ATP/maltotriose-dependent transcriptional regulator MalT